MVTIAAPHAVEIEFHDDDEWCDIVFNSLAKNAEQTRLRISCLPKVTDLAKTVLETMVQKGVCLELGFLDDEVLKNMPPCHFESLELWKIVSLTKSNCTFRKLKLSEIIPNDFACVPVDFHADYVEEIVIKQSEDVVPIEDLFPNLKRIFPKADKLTVTIDVDFYDVKHTLFTSGNLAYYSS
uniref:FTH domain-containing protein n=1 Tax=Panagrolaimus sp. JU765 TaxID=591449 RepID=A0AC34RBK8_9BILA